MKKKLKKDNLKNITYLEDLYEIIKKRDKEKIKKSYTKQLLRKGSNTIAQKVAEESTELIIDYLDGSKKRTIEEASD